MRLKLLRLNIVISCLIIFSENINAQSFSFNCSRDTTVSGCPPVLCITLKGIIPDIHKQSDSYTLNPSSAYPNGCFPVYVAPDDPAGTATNLLIDDRYSGVINIGFPFSFYGSTYTSLIASTNGYLSFDISKANGTAHWIINNDLPSTSYDRAMIMGPYHDLDPSLGTSPTQRIQYQVWGTAPLRRWVLSFYKVPLFSISGACNSLIENTHQIILYESTGIIEVTIFDKQTCLSWNSGRAIVGIQDFNRTLGMMAPGRTALGPTWGSLRMNESWRFVPAGGPSLFKRVELYDLSGTLLGTGTTSNIGSGNLEASFPNVCAPAGATTSYIIRSVYEKFDDPTVEIFGTDTVRINRAAGLTGTASSTPASCGINNGTITVSGVTGGITPYEYSLDGITWQSGNVYSGLAAGSYTVQVRDASTLCTRSIAVTVTLTGALSATTNTTPTACTGVNNGSITITTAGGTGPYTFTLDGGIPQAGILPFTFYNVNSGAHTIVVTDLSNGCTSNVIPVTVAVGPSLTTTVSKTDALCNGGATGTITVTQPVSGTPPFQYSLDGVTWQFSNSFMGLTAGTYTVYYRESNGCQGSQSITISEPTALTASAAAVAVVCNGQSNGIITVTSGGGISPYQYSIDGGTIWQSSNVFNVAAGSYTITIRDANNCTTTQTVSVTEPAALTAFSANGAASCDGGNDGVITITANGGNAGYQYSLDGVTFQSSNSFSVAPGNYTVTVKDNLGCITTFPTTVLLGSNFTLTRQTDPTICEGRSKQLQLISNATQYAWTPATGLSSTTIANPVANPIVTTQYIVTATLGRCSGNDTVIVNVNTAPVPNAGADGFICFGQTYSLQASGGTQYSWSPTTYLDNPSISNPVSTPTKDITYTLSIYLPGYFLQPAWMFL